MEYKAYQIRSALREVVSPIFGEVLEKEELEGQKINIIERNVGDEIELATIKFKVNTVEEKQVLSSEYGTPAVAKEDAKFVVIDMNITNITNNTFTFYPDDAFRLIDNKEREFMEYEYTIGSVDNYWDGRRLSPFIKESGVLVYEIPKDATSYNLVVGKAGTNEIYKVLLEFTEKLIKETEEIKESEFEEPVKKIYNLGSRIQIEDVVVRVMSFTDYDYEISSEFLQPILQPKTGNKYVATEIDIINIGSEPIDYNMLMFALVDENNKTYPHALIQKEPILGGTLQPWGKTLKSIGIGYITWEVPKDALGFKLIISFPWFTERPIVNLGK